MRNVTRSWWPALVLSLASGLVGCQASIGAGVLGGSSTPPPPSGPPPAGDGSGGGGAVAAGGPSCPEAANHCLQADEIFVGDRAFQTGWVRTYVGKQVAPPGSTGEARFLMLHDGSEMTSKFFWKTHRASDQEIAVGALVMAFDEGTSEGYRAPESREEALKGEWFLSRIVSVDGLAQGVVMVSGGYIVKRDNLRRIDGDDSPIVSAPGVEDQWFVKPEHWFVSDRALPDKGWTRAYTAFVVKPPSAQTGNEGQFLLTHDGELKWSKFAWRTRPATPDELKLGATVIAFDEADGNGYHPPQNRGDAIHGEWFIAKITDTSEAYKGVVTLAGSYKTQMTGLRVVVP